jgi:transcriptional regulator with XRE-family HTH domain
MPTVHNLDGSNYSNSELRPPDLSPEACKAARLQLGLSQQDLASKAGLSIGTITNFERGRSALRPFNARVILDCFARSGIQVKPDGRLVVSLQRA